MITIQSMSHINICNTPIGIHMKILNITIDAGFYRFDSVEYSDKILIKRIIMIYVIDTYINSA